VQLFTRNGHDWTQNCRNRRGIGRPAPGIGVARRRDGGRGRGGRAGLPGAAKCLRGRSQRHIVYYLFDLPYLNGVDLREVPVEERRAALATVLKAMITPCCVSPTALKKPGGVAQQRLPDADGRFDRQAPGVALRVPRSSDWIKLKCKHRQEFVIVGFTDPKGSRSAFGALLLGLHDRDSGELRYAGKVGTGFNEATLKSIHDQLKPLQVKKAAVVNPPSGFEPRGALAQTESAGGSGFAEMTKDGSVRHAVFHGLRDDKPAKASPRSARNP
jgi:bifunctional non-homologous end joining protein LigD